MLMDIVYGVAEAGFWLCALTIIGVYLGYPLALWMLPARRRPAASRGWQPAVTIVIAAFNEASCIAATIRNKLAQDYPAELLDIIVVSDGSTDGTDERARAVRTSRLTVIRQEPRQGKTLALNRAVSIARGEIVVFSDANSHFETAAVSRLVEALDDPDVGYVTGRLIYEDSHETAVGGGSNLYIRYENWVRRLETRVGSVVGVNGGVDAVRTRLYRPMRVDQLPDLVLPLRVVEQGYRVAFAESARAREASLGRQGDEFSMRVRVSLRALHALWDMRALLHPRYGLFAVQLFVHKVVRYLLVLPLIGALLCSGVLAASPGYALLFGLQLTCYALAIAGWISGGRIRFRPVFVPFYFALLNAAAATAILRFLRGERQVLWTPRKGT